MEPFLSLRIYVYAFVNLFLKEAVGGLPVIENFWDH